MSNQTSARGLAMRFDARGFLMPLFLGLLVTGCGSKAEIQDTKEGLAVAEAKADAAEKRSKEALSMAATSDPAPQAAYDPGVVANGDEPTEPLPADDFSSGESSSTENGIQ